MEKKSIKGTRTEHNLLASFAGESQARSRYTLFAEKAREEGYEQIAAIFMDTAEQELSHARMFFSLLEGGTVEITAGYPAGVVGDTKTNLAEAAAGEREEWSDLYENFAQTAQDEGFLRLPTLSALSQKLSRCMKPAISNFSNALKAALLLKMPSPWHGSAVVAVS